VTQQPPSGYPLLLSLLFSKDCYQLALKNRIKFSILANHGDSEVIRFYWRYCEKFAEAPVDRKALESLVASTPQASIEALEPEWDALETVEPGSITDFNTTLANTFEAANRNYVAVLAAKASRIANGLVGKGALRKEIEQTYGEDQSTWPYTAIAEDFFRKHSAQNPFANSEPEVDGIYQDNTAAVRERLLEVFAEDNTAGGLQTLLPSIDDNVIIGCGFQQNRMVGIAGQSEHGKTLFMLASAYNIASQGYTILYNALEHQPLDSWILMAFLHTFKFADRFSIPPLDVWAQGNRARFPVTEKDVKNFDIVQADAASRVGLPGVIDACRLRTWDQIVARLKTRVYDAVFIDYLEQLDDATSKFRPDDEYVKLLKKVQKFSQTYNNNRGIVVFTPLTITKEASKQAGDLEENSLEVPFTGTAIRGASQILYDMDLVIGVHSTPDMRLNGEMTMWGIKRRFGRAIPLTALQVDPRSKYVRDLRGHIDRREGHVESVIVKGPVGGDW
jgi:hypothetical protein